MGNRLFMLVSPCCNLVCAFATVFSEKSPILGAKVAKTSILAFLSVFLGTSLGALAFITEVAKVDGKQLKTSRVLLHNEKITKKAVGVLFGTHFV